MEGPSKQKPALRSAESLMANYSVYKANGSVVQSKGVINKPVLHNFLLDHVFLPCLQINMGIWNKIFDTPKATFAKSAEEPHMSRSAQAGIMNAHIADLQQVIVSKSAFLATLQGQLQEQKTHLANLNAYMRKLTKELEEAQRAGKKAEKDICTLEAEIK